MKKIITAIIVFLCMGSLFTLPVFSKDKSLSKAEEKELDGIEKLYKSETEDILDNYGLENSGINMTKVIYEDGAIEYTVSIHNEKIDHMDAARKDVMQEELDAVPFGKENTVIMHQFI